jgi:hypothetical protein
MNRDKDL